MKKLNELLYERRKALKLGTEYVAAKIGKSKRTYAYYEDPVKPRRPSHETLLKLAEILKFDLAEIYKGNDNETMQPVSRETSVHSENATNNQLVEILKGNIEDLRKNVNAGEERFKLLVNKNDELKTTVHASLKTVLDNQLTLTCLFESYLKAFSELMIEEPKQQQDFRLSLHRDAFVQVRDLLKKGNQRVEIDSDDIISRDS